MGKQTLNKYFFDKTTMCWYRIPSLYDVVYIEIFSSNLMVAVTISVAGWQANVMIIIRY